MLSIYRNATLLQLYKTEDKNEKGDIPKSRLMSITEEKFPELSKNTITDWMDIYDTDMDDRIKPDEFVNSCNYMMTR